MCSLNKSQSIYHCGVWWLSGAEIAEIVLIMAACSLNSKSFRSIDTDARIQTFVVDVVVVVAHIKLMYHIHFRFSARRLRIFCIATVCVCLLSMSSRANWFECLCGFFYHFCPSPLVFSYFSIQKTLIVATTSSYLFLGGWIMYKVEKVMVKWKPNV